MCVFVLSNIWLHKLNWIWSILHTWSDLLRQFNDSFWPQINKECWYFGGMNMRKQFNMPIECILTLPTKQYDFQNEKKDVKENDTRKSTLKRQRQRVHNIFFIIWFQIWEKNYNIKVLFSVFLFLWPHKSEMFILNEKIAPEISY